MAVQTSQDAQPHVCLSTLYHNFPRIATWITGTKKWKERKRVVTTDNSIQCSYKNGYPPVGHIYFVDPKEGERFFLRLLLLKIEGATSFDDLKTTYDAGIPTIHASYQDACRDMGLLQDDSEWVNCMETASTFAHPIQLRNLFVTILLYNSVSDPPSLWNQFRECMSEDFLHRARRTDNARDYDNGVFSHALRSISMSLRSNGRSLEQFHLPLPTSLLPGEGNIQIDEERSKYNSNAQSIFRDTFIPKLNEKQMVAYQTIMHFVHAVKEYNAVVLGGETMPPFPDVPTCFFVDGLGGSGKTFLYNTLLSSIRADNGIALAVASSGIAALLLEGGWTAHSRFKIPVNGINDLSTCIP